MFQANAHCPGVSIQVLGYGHSFHGGGDCCEPFAGEFLKGNFFYEGIQGGTAVSTGKAIGRQRMIGTRGIISYGFGRIIAQEDRACVGDFFCEFLGMGNGEDEVFWRISFDEFQCFLTVTGDDGDAVMERLLRNFPSGEVLELRFNL